MIYYEGSDIIIRNMTYSDTTFIVMSEMKQEGKMELKKYHCRLYDQEKGRNIALVAEYKDVNADSKGVIAGYVNVYPFSQHGIFGGEGYTEIVDLKVIGQDRTFEIWEKLLKVAEEIASDYSGTVYTSVGFHDGDKLNMFVKQGYIPDRSGFLYQNKTCFKCSDCKNDDDLALWLSKNLRLTNVYKFPMINTPEYPFLKWWADGKKTIYLTINIEKYQKIKVGDKITLEDPISKDFITGKVVFRHEYDTYKKLLKAEGVRNIFPFLRNDDFDKALLFYRSFAGTELVNKYGCIAFGIVVESNNYLKNG